MDCLLLSRKNGGGGTRGIQGWRRGGVDGGSRLDTPGMEHTMEIVLIKSHLPH